MWTRRTVIGVGFGLLAGCSQLDGDTTTPNQTAENSTTTVDTTIPPQDHTLPDLEINNERASKVTVTVAWIPEGDSQPSLTVTIRLGPDESVVWGEIPLFSTSGTITASLENEDEREEREWKGDNQGDNRGLVVTIGDYGIEIMALVS